MGWQIDMLLIGTGVAALACVMIFLTNRPGRGPRTEMAGWLWRGPGRKNEQIASLPSEMPEQDQPTETLALPRHSVFISYRRMDSEHIVGRLYENLASCLGADTVFKDVDSLILGGDFRPQLEASLNACLVFLCVMGDQWAGPAGTQPRLIDDPDDFVRLEVETALRRNIPLIPVFVHGIRMPPADFFPASLHDLAYKQGTRLRPDPDFRTDLMRLIDSIKKHLHEHSPKATEQN